MINLDDVSTEDLKKELSIREEKLKQIKNLQDRQAILQKEMSLLSEQISRIAPKTRVAIVEKKLKPETYVINKHAVQQTVLRDRIINILAANKAPMRAKEILEKLIESGWHTESKNPYYPIATMLSANPKVFAKIERGLYFIKDAI